MTALTQHIQIHNPGITKSFPNDPAHKALKKALEQLKKGDSNAYQVTMLKFYKAAQGGMTKTKEYKAWKKEHDAVQKQNDAICRKNEGKPESQRQPVKMFPERPFDIPYQDMGLDYDCLFGNHREMWSDTFADGCTFSREAKCDKCNYNEKLTHTSINMINIPDEDTIPLFMGKSVYHGYEFPCHKPNCEGKVTVGELKAEKTPWMLTWDLGTLPHHRAQTAYEDMFVNDDLPKSLKVGQHRFLLSHILVNKQEEHYTSIHYDHESKSWAYYDGKTDFQKENSK